MKVLHLFNELRYSGAEVMIKTAKDLFDANGIQTTILCTGTNRGPYSGVLENCGYRIDHIPFQKSVIYFFRLYVYLKKHKFDVVHLHPERAFFYHAFITRLATNASVFRTYHDVFMHYGGLKRSIRRFQRHVSRKLFNVTGLSIGHSVFHVEMSQFSNPTEIIYNWIDEDEYRYPSKNEKIQARKSFQIEPDDFVLCTVGTCNQKKRHFDIIHAVEKLLPSMPNLKLLHRGTGPDTEIEKQYVIQNGLERSIIFVEYLKLMPTLYWASDGFIFSSQWEGLGNVIMEAIACGLPVILYDGHGMQDFKPTWDQNYGYWIDPDRQSFDHVIWDFYQTSPDQIRRFSKNARRLFETKFSRQKSVSRLIRLYGSA